MENTKKSQDRYIMIFIESHPVFYVNAKTMDLDVCAENVKLYVNAFNQHQSLKTDIDTQLFDDIELKHFNFDRKIKGKSEIKEAKTLEQVHKKTRDYLEELPEKRENFLKYGRAF